MVRGKNRGPWVGGLTCDTGSTWTRLVLLPSPPSTPPCEMHPHALTNVSISLLEVYADQVRKAPPFYLSTRLSHLQVFLIPLATWTPEIIQREDGPESFGLFVSYSFEYGVLEFFDNNSFEYCGPMDFREEIVEAATRADIVQYRRFVSKTRIFSPVCL